MNEITIYQAEQDAGIAKLILDQNSLAYSTLASPSTANTISKNIIGKARAYNQGQLDLFGLNSILVSTGWNGNDDVFDRGEVHAARLTPTDKPFNYEHNCDDIIGHITAAWEIDEDGRILPDEITYESLPEKYHIKTEAVLYKYWDKEELQERMDKIIAEIPQGGWFVSMEALFTNFDYAIITPQNEQKIISRSQATAYLSKFLKAYGGNGVYEEYRIGRLLRNITFSGKGLVRRPANPDSIITTASFKSVASLDKLEQVMSQDNKEMDELKTAVANKDGQIKSLKEQLDAANEKLDKAAAELKETRASLETRTGELEAEKKVSAGLVAAIDEHKTAVETLTKANAEVTKELSEIKDSHKQEIRKAALKAAGKSDEEVTALYEKYASLSDDLFNGIVDLVKATAGVVVDETDLDTVKEDEPTLAVAASIKVGSDELLKNLRKQFSRNKESK